MSSTSGSTTSYKIVVAALCAVMSIICLFIICVCMGIRKDKTRQRGYLCTSVSAMLFELSMACTGGLAEQFFIIENISMSTGIVIVQTFFSAVMSVFIFLFIAPRKKRNILMVLFFICMGFGMANYVSYFITVISLSITNLLIPHVITCISAVIFFVGGVLLLKMGDQPKVDTSDKKKEAGVTDGN